MKIFSIEKNDVGKRLDVFLRENLEGYSAKKLKAALLAFTCKINNKVERFASYRVQKGDKISFDEKHFFAEKLYYNPQMLLYEDDNYFIIDKPAHLICDNTQIQKFLEREVYLAHRLDKQTSGVLILAKNSCALQKMENLFKQRKIKKSYLAIVCGAFNHDQLTLSKPVKKMIQFDGGSIWKCHKNGVMAKTKFELLASNNKMSFVRCEPETGRTHQIRVHLSYLGFPVLGDCLYGEESCAHQRFMLHGESVSFIHPFTKQALLITAKPPQEFFLSLKENKIDDGIDLSCY